MKQSTKAFREEGKQIPGYSLFDFIHGYIYGRWPYFYIGTAINPPRILKPLVKAANWLIRHRENRRRKGYSATKIAPPTIADTYHGKVVPLKEVTRLVQVNEDISLTVPEYVIPFDVARDIVFEHPDHIVALDCPCRMSRENPCLPLDVCIIVGEPFVSFLLEHQPDHARQIASEEAVRIIEAEDKRGHVHHAFFKDAMLERFYAICNCCSCCCGAMSAYQNGIPMLISSGFVCQPDEALCVGCGACAEKCQFDALEIQDGHVMVDVAACMGCGICVNTCPQNAMTLVRMTDRPAPLEIEQLMRQAALRK
jgi:ferredoxin